jgi:hypothetical protein
MTQRQSVFRFQSEHIIQCLTLQGTANWLWQQNLKRRGSKIDDPIANADA